MDTNAEELDDNLVKRMVSLKEEGDRFADKGSYLEAINYYKSAYELLPKPRDAWEAATWILGIIGDAYFLNRDYEDAFGTFNLALQAPGAIGNPFIHLRLGQSAFELGDIERAKDELMRAYMGAGEEIFFHDDPQYLEFLGKHANIKISKAVRRKR